MAAKRALVLVGLTTFLGAVSLAISDVHGTFDVTVTLLPSLELYRAELELATTLAGWEVTSESKFYSTGWRYQNFYIDGALGDFEVWGKVYFHAQDVRYQKSWINLELPLPGEDNYMRFSVNHWASVDDYFSSDVSMFGPWPCLVWWETLLPWDEKRASYENEKLCVQGPVVSYWPTSPTSYVTLNVGAPYPDPRFLVYITGDAFTALQAELGPDFWDDLVGKTICVCGTIKDYKGDPEIALYDTADAEGFHVGACCAEPNSGLGPLMIYRTKVAWEPITLTVDFFDCCEGIAFKKLELDLSDMVGCCGFLWNAGLSFTKCHGFEELYVNFKEIPFPCCDITLEANVILSVDGKMVSIKPNWQGLVTGCLEVYGDVQWADETLQGFALYGFSIECAIDPVSIRAVTAFDPDKVEDMTDVSFYTGEFEYLELAYTGSGCCGGDLTFTSEFWFGSGGLLFDLQRTRFNLEFPIYDGFTVVIKGQWDFSEPSPLDWFDIGWKVEF